MALIKIFSNGSFELSTPADANVAVAASSAKELKADYAALRKELALRVTIQRLKDRVDLLTTSLKHAKPTAKEGFKTRIEAVKGKIEAARAQRQFPRLSPLAISKRIRKVEVALRAAQGTKPGVKAPATSTKPAVKPVAKVRASAPPSAAAIKRATQGTKPARAKTAASFDVEARRAARSTNMGIRSELRQHAKAVLSPVANKPGAQAKKIPVAKTSAAAKHPVKQGQAPITATLAVIKGIKAQIATGLTGAKLARARQDLAKNREALAVLRAGKTAKNQASIVKPGTAKHLGGAKKIVGKESGMGDASKKPATSPKEMEKIKGMHANSDAALDRQLVRRKTRLKEMQAEYRKAAAGPAKTRLGVQIANMVKSIVKIS